MYSRRAARSISEFVIGSGLLNNYAEKELSVSWVRLRLLWNSSVPIIKIFLTPLMYGPSKLLGIQSNLRWRYGFHKRGLYRVSGVCA